MTNLHRCDNCGETFNDKGIIALDMVKDLAERLTPASIVPSGECTHCHSLTYLSVVDVEQLQRNIAKRQGICSDEWHMLDADEAHVDTTEEGLWCTMRIWCPLEDTEGALIPESKP